MTCCCCVSSLIYAVGAFVILKTLLPLLHKLVFGKKEPELLEKDWKKDTVYLYQLHGSPTLPSISPFCIKVEGFLRLHKIKFERRYVIAARGSNGKVPFIELNGEQIADSQIILRRLAKQFSIKEYANAKDAGIGHALSRQADNHTLGVFGYYKISTGTTQLVRIVLGDSVPEWLSSVLLPLLPLRCMFMKRVQAGMGKFREAEHAELLENELVSLQNVLGNNKYLLGGDITSADLAVFSHLAAAFYFEAENEVKRLLNTARFEKLKQYTNRVRDDVFGSECHE